MYAKDVTDSPLTRTKQMRQMKYVALFAVLFIVVIFLRVQAGVFTYRMPYAGIILNIIALFLLVDGAISIYRKAIFNEKIKIREYEAAVNSMTLDKYSKLDLKADIQNSYRYIQDIYIPETGGLNVVFLKFVHYSKPENPIPNQELFRFLFNYCMGNNLILTRYDMNQGNKLKSFQYKSDLIKTSKLGGEQLRRASLRLDYQREICSHSRVTTEVVQIAATNMTNNLKFLEHVKTILAELDSKGSSYRISVLLRDDIIEFIQDFNKLSTIGLPELASSNVNTARAANVRLQKDVFANGEEIEYFTPTVPVKKFKRM